jgi:hypothetical protein
VYELDDRLRSYELLAGIAGLSPAPIHGLQPAATPASTGPEGGSGC